MLKNQNIICVSWLRWDSLPFHMHYMMSKLATNNRILFVDPPVVLSTLLFHPRKALSLLRRIYSWFKGGKRVKKNLYVFYPPPLLLQFGHSKLDDKFNQFFLVRSIRKAAKKLKFTTPILWLYDPYAINPKGQFGEKLVCYDCCDNISSFTNIKYRKKSLSFLENELSRKADIIFATSAALYDKHIALNHNTHHLPPGVDTRHFQKVLSADCKMVEGVQKPGSTKIEECLNEDQSTDLINRRVEIANTNSWDNRVEKCSKLIQDILDR